MSHSVDTLLEIAEQWMNLDPDETTRSATKAIVSHRELAELMEYFGSELAFGTAGMRGALGPGPNRMNRLMVQRVTGGLGRYLEGPVPCRLMMWTWLSCRRASHVIMPWSQGPSMPAYPWPENLSMI